MPQQHHNVIEAPENLAPDSTLWENPTERTVKFEIRLGPDGWNPHLQKAIENVRRYRLEPGQRVYIPSEFDTAIQKLSDDGRTIIAGLAPQLRRVTDGDPPELHPALDTSAQERKQAEANALSALLQKQASEEALAKAGQGLAGTQHQTPLPTGTARSEETRPAASSGSGGGDNTGRSRSGKSGGAASPASGSGSGAAASAVPSAPGSNEPPSGSGGGSGPNTGSAG
jgi:hypothetical protein